MNSKTKKLQEEDFFALAKKENHPRKKTRLLALGHLAAGKGRKDVADMLGVHTISIGRWISRYMKGGVNGLEEGARSGRRSILPKKRKEEFIEAVKELQKKKGKEMTGNDVHALLQEKFDAHYSFASVYQLLRRYGLSPSKNQHKKIME